ncbi:hypothetical protein D3C84_706160 [compost metagenome]
MLADQAGLEIVREAEWPVIAIIDPQQSAEAVVAILHLIAIGQGLDQQAPRPVTSVAGDQHGAVIAELGFLQQMPLGVIAVSRTPPVETGFLLDQSDAAVHQPILFAYLVFNFAEQPPGVVIAITKLSAIRIDPTPEQVQFVVVLVAYDLPQLILLGRHLATVVVAEGAGCAVRQGHVQPSVLDVIAVLGRCEHPMSLVQNEGERFCISETGC